MVDIIRSCECSSFCADEHRERLRGAGGLAAIMSAVEALPDYEPVQTMAVRALSYVLLNGQSHVSRLLV